MAKSMKDIEKEYQKYLQKTKGMSQMTREQWVKFNYPEQARTEEIQQTHLSRQSRGQLETLDSETYEDVMKILKPNRKQIARVSRAKRYGQRR